MSLLNYNALIFPEKEAHFLLPGPSGQLEVRSSYPPCQIDKSVLGVICHPHPLMGGTMDNKVVYTVAQAFRNLGYPSLRFNFRGVGESTGAYDHGLGETDDLLAILAWAKKTNTAQAIYLAGFSFGSFVAARAAQAWQIQQLILIAPPIERFDFQALTPFHCPCTVIQGDQDEIVTPEAVFAWAGNFPSIKYYCLTGATHFFHGQLLVLRQTISKILPVGTTP